MTRLVHFSDVHLTAKPLGWVRRDLLSKRITGWVNVRVLGRGRRFKNAPTVAAAMMRDIRSRGADGLVFSGDATAFGFESELMATAAVLGVGDETLPPAVAVPGNHDYYTKRAIRDGTFERVFAPWQQGVRIGPDPYPFARQIGGVWLVCLNTSTVNRWHWDASGAAGEVQLQSLRTLCAALTPGPRVLVTHYPIRTARGTLEPRVHRLRDHAAVLAAAIDCNVCLWLHGHIHRGFLLSPSPTIPFGVLNPGSATQNNRWTYHEYQISDGKVAVLRRVFDPNAGSFRDAEFREMPLPT